MEQQWIFVLIGLGTGIAAWAVSFVTIPQPTEWSKAGDVFLRAIGVAAFAVAIHFSFFHQG